MSGNLLRFPALTSDPSIVFKDGRWWLVLKDLDTLLLFQAENLTGSWSSIPGALSCTDRQFLQTRRQGDCSSTASSAILRTGTLFTETPSGAGGRDHPETYREHEVLTAILPVASGSGWNASETHNIDPHCNQ